MHSARRRRGPRPRHAIALGAAALLGWAALPVPEAAAQLLRNSAPRSEQAPAARPPPAALPGLQGRRAPEPIPGDPNQNLSPNAALFDAINRGDLPAAREAVARGADTEARNVLGLTPVDAAVDQGRTEIMFYLLSVRGASRVAGPPPEAEPQRRPAGRQAPPPRGDARRGREDSEPPRLTPGEAPAPVRGARLWAGDGGAPNPALGFLGFDAGRPAGAAPPAAAGAAPARNGRTARGAAATGRG
jgi:ankyrin repeat protein